MLFICVGGYFFVLDDLATKFVQDPRMNVASDKAKEKRKQSSVTITTSEDYGSEDTAEN